MKTSPPSPGRHYFDLLTALVERDMRLRYKRSLLGVVWTLINPLAQFVVLFVVFDLLIGIEVENFAVFLFIGIVAWAWFSSALLQATVSVVENRNLIQKPGFPASILSVVAALSHLLHFLLTLPIVIGMAWFLDLPVGLSLLALPVVVVLQFGLILGLGLALSSVYVFFRDTQYVLSLGLMLGFYGTPIFYPVEQVPERFRMLYQLNPMTLAISAYRAILLDGVAPPIGQLMGLAAAVVLALLLGVACYRKLQAGFLEEL